MTNETFRCLDCDQRIPDGHDVCPFCAANSAKQDPNPTVEMTTMSCLQCEKVLVAPTAYIGKGQFFICSEECGLRYYGHRRTFEEIRHCFWCGSEFEGTTKARFCSDRCRVTSHRAEGKGAAASLRVRFAVLERDSFKCQYCGASPKDGAILHVDHINPRSNDGTAAMHNLITACRDCNLGKGAHILSSHPALP